MRPRRRPGGHRVGAAGGRTTIGSPWCRARPASITTWSAMRGAERALASVRLLTSGTAPLEPDDFALVRDPDGTAGLGGIRALGVRVRGHQFAAHRRGRTMVRSAGRWPGSSCGSSGPTGMTSTPDSRPGQTPGDAEPRPHDRVGLRRRRAGCRRGGPDRDPRRHAVLRVLAGRRRRPGRGRLVRHRRHRISRRCRRAASGRPGGRGDQGRRLHRLPAGGRGGAGHPSRTSPRWRSSGCPGPTVRSRSSRCWCRGHGTHPTPTT